MNGWEDGSLRFSTTHLYAWYPVDWATLQATDDYDDYISWDLTGVIELKAGKLRKFTPYPTYSPETGSGGPGQGTYTYGRGTFSITTDHGKFTASVPEIEFEVYGDLEGVYGIHAYLPASKG
jgi:hypothetical protein